MAFSQGQLDAVETAIASGVLRVSYEGKSSEFRSLDDLIRVRGLIRRALGLDANVSATVIVAHDRGFPASGTQEDSELFSGF